MGARQTGIIRLTQDICAFPSEEYYHLHIMCRDWMEIKLSTEAKRRLPTCDCGLGHTFPSTWRLSFLINTRRKACGSRALHGKLMHTLGVWKNEVMCWNWSHTWKTSGGKAEAREHWAHAQHCLSLWIGVWILSWSDHFLASCMLYLRMRGQWWMLFYLEYSRT